MFRRSVVEINCAIILVLLLFIHIIGVTATAATSDGVIDDQGIDDPGIGDVSINDVVINGKNATEYLPLLEKTRQRVLPRDKALPMYVGEVATGLFVVSDGVYQSAFLKTSEGVVVLDAPTRYGNKLPEIIRRYIPDTPITHLVYSHSHKDHIGGSQGFRNIDGLQVLAHERVSQTLKDMQVADVLMPSITFAGEYRLELGQQVLLLKDHGNFHSSDADIFVYLPKQKFLYAVDIIEPGYVPFKALGFSANIFRYKNIFADILAYDFTLFLAGHLDVLGNRQDVIDTRDYVNDLESISARLIRTVSPAMVFSAVFSALKSDENKMLAYRYYLDEIARQCAEAVTMIWKDRLSGVDVWSKSHCEVMQGYLLMNG